MPNFKKHFVTGAVVAGGANLAWQIYKLHSSPKPPNGVLDTLRQVNPFEVALFAFGGGVVASIPDLLEPATSPNHRGLFHSLGCGIAVVWLAFGKHTDGLDSESRFSIRAAALSYLSHLFLDGQTPKSLPLTGLLSIEI